MERKKGIQLNQAFGAVLTLVLVAVLVIIAIVIFVNLGDSFAASATTTGNDTITQAEFTAGGDSVLLDNTSLCGSSDFVISTDVVNDSRDVINSANYTLTTAGVFTNLTSEFPNSNWHVETTSTWGSEACTASDEFTSEFDNYTSLVGLVGTILFLGLVIGILVTAFAFGGRKEV